MEVVNANSQIDLSFYDVIILSSGVYANHFHKNLIGFINKLTMDSLKPNVLVYTFITWFGRGKSDKASYDEVHHLLQSKGIKVQDDYMKCYGKGMKIIRASHPNQQDYDKVTSWINKLG